MNRTRSILITFFILMYGASGIYGQHLVSGIILDKITKEALIGASVLEQGTNSGTITDIDGSFELSVQSPNAVLEISFLGYADENVEILGRTNLVILLNEECLKCWFDYQEVNLFFYSGVLNTPYGGKLEISSPVLFNEPVLKGSFRFQTDFMENNFLALGASLNHLLSTCSFDADIVLQYNRLRLENVIPIDDYSVAINLNWNSSINPVLGVKRASFAEDDVRFNKYITLYGLGLSANSRFLVPMEINTLINFGSRRINYNAQVKGYYRGLKIALEFYKLMDANVLSLGLGYEFRYLFTRQKYEYQKARNGQ